MKHRNRKAQEASQFHAQLGLNRAENNKTFTFKRVQCASKPLSVYNSRLCEEGLFKYTKLEFDIYHSCTRVADGASGWLRSPHGQLSLVIDFKLTLKIFHGGHVSLTHIYIIMLLEEIRRCSGHTAPTLSRGSPARDMYMRV